MCEECGNLNLKRSRSEILYQKYRVEDIQELLEMAGQFQKTRYAPTVPEVLGLCDGVFIGEV